jgi:signal transduction histidine kinase
LRRGSIRLRLTLLFGGLFLAAGAALLAITYGLVSHATDGIIVARTYAGSVPAGSAPENLPAPQQFQGQATESAAGARAAENDTLLMDSGIALGIMAVVSTALGWFAAGRSLRPLRRITAAARRISATNLHERLALEEPDDDLRELADMIDDLFGRLDASFDAQRQFVANASHELRTPLARSRTLLEVALRDPAASGESLRATCHRVLAAGEEQERLIEALLTLARGQRGLDRREPLDLAAVTRDMLAARGTEITARGLTMTVTLAPALLLGDRPLTQRAVANLIDNALRHNVPAGAGGAVWVTVGTESGQAVLTVENTGPAVPPAEIGRLLVPFERGGTAPQSRARPPASGDGPGQGLGLGLPIVRAIAATHGGALTIAARAGGGGLAAGLSFPAHPAAPPEWHARDAPAGAPGARESVPAEARLVTSANR